MDSSEYTRLNPAHIPADERFLYTYVLSWILMKKILIWNFRYMKMRKENSDAAEQKKKGKSSDDDFDDNESIESVSDDEFDKYLGK